jgi:CheY-like chemotaxis protein
MTSTSSSRILVVDDHDLNLKLLQRVLELDGHDVIAVSTLSAAERAIARELPALVVLDLNLPDGDGLDLARKLKLDPRTAGCAILACTAGAMSGDRDRALEAGCDAYMSKPIDTREFSTLASSLLVRRAPLPN